MANDCRAPRSSLERHCQTGVETCATLNQMPLSSRAAYFRHPKQFSIGPRSEFVMLAD